MDKNVLIQIELRRQFQTLNQICQIVQTLKLYLKRNLIICIYLIHIYLIYVSVNLFCNSSAIQCLDLHMFLPYIFTSFL